MIKLNQIFGIEELRHITLLVGDDKTKCNEELLIMGY